MPDMLAPPMLAGNYATIDSSRLGRNATAKESRKSMSDSGGMGETGGKRGTGKRGIRNARSESSEGQADEGVRGKVTP